MIRKLKKNDYTNIIKLLDLCKPYVIPHHIYSYWILEKYYSSTSFVAEHENKIIGFISGMTSIDKSAVFIWQICVHPKFRKKGIALDLLNSVYKAVKELGLNSIELSISNENIPSKKLFAKFADINNLKIIKVDEQKFGDITEDVYNIR